MKVKDICKHTVDRVVIVKNETDIVIAYGDDIEDFFEYDVKWINLIEYQRDNVIALELGE